MATVTTITYSTTNTVIFTSMATLATSTIAGAGSAAISQASAPTNQVDSALSMKFVYSANVPVGPVFYGIGMSTDATNYGNPYTGSDAAITLLQRPNFPTNFVPGPGGSLLWPASMIYYAISMDLTGYATTPTVYMTIPSVASCIGSPNVLPQKWGVFCQNTSGFAFASQASTYWGITYTNT